MNNYNYVRVEVFQRVKFFLIFYFSKESNDISYYINLNILLLLNK